MRYMIICGCCLLLLFSCRQNEIEEYADIPRIGFENASNQGYISERYVIFTDEDYLSHVTEKTDSIKIELMGKALVEPGTCCFKRVDEGEVAPLQVDMPDHLVIAPGIYFVYLKFKVFRPVSSGVVCSSLLEFDADNPAHGFAAGKAEGKQMRIVGEFRLKPLGWNNYFGAYSDGKYRFMLDFFGGIYSSVGNTSENRRLVREAYAEYRLANPAIVDENGLEIVFP